MPRFGYTLMCEQMGPRQLVRQAQLAEEAGFDFLVVSDHFHPWLDEQGESPYAWTVLGAVAAVTERIPMMTMVTCPIVRYHPALVAQKAATMAVLSEGRFALGLGAGENLNEHVVGMGWPPADVRHRMLEEAIAVIRELWAGGWVSFDGEYFTVYDARLYTLPEQPPPIYVAAGGVTAAKVAAELAEGLIATEPLPELMRAYRAAGGPGQGWGQVALSFGPDEAGAVENAHRYLRFSMPGWKVMSELPNPANFAAMAQLAKPADVGQKVASGPDPERHVQAIRQYVEAGFENVALLQAGPDQEGFIKFWERELALQLRREEAVPV